MSNVFELLGRLVLRWLVIWAVLLAWWWATWTLFNQANIVGGLVVGLGLPAAVTLLSVWRASKRPSLEEDDA